MKKIIYTIGFALSMFFLLNGCSVDNSYNFGTITAPSNIKISANIVGLDADHPYGDGSGKVTFTATSNNAITYKFIQGNTGAIAPDGIKIYTFGRTGINKYSVTVEAIGTAGVSSSKTIEVEVLVLFTPSANFLSMLTANSSKTWRIKYETTGHFGVGPADSNSPIWWSAVPNDKTGVGVYDDQFVFSADGTFTHITNGDTWGKAIPMAQDLGGDKGLTPNSDGEYINYPYADYSETWSLSESGGQESIQLSGVGYLGFYVGGTHKYTILSRSNSELSLKTIGADGLGWFFILVAQ